MARTFIRATAAAGVLGLGLVSMSPAVAATDNQAGATALFLSIAGNGQGTGTVTATYENGKETKTGDTTPAFPQPAQDAIKLGVLAQEATATPGFSAACAGLAGDGGSVLNIGDSSCLKPGKALKGSLSSLDLDSLLGANPAAALTDQLAAVPGAATLLSAISGGQASLVDALNAGLAQAKTQFGNAGLEADLDLIEGRCTAGDGGPTGTSTLTNAKIVLSGLGQSVTLLDLPTNPAPNTHLTTDLSQVVQMILDAVKTDLESSLGSQGAPLQAVITQIETPLVAAIQDQVEANLKPLEDNVLDIVLNEQEHPTADSIKVRALHAQVLPAAKAQLGASLVDLQIGDAACAPVARTATAVSPPQAVTPPVANPKTPTAVSSGLASVPGQQQGLDASTWALVALAGLGLASAGLVGARRLFR